MDAPKEAGEDAEAVVAPEDAPKEKTGGGDDDTGAWATPKIPPPPPPATEANGGDGTPPNIGDVDKEEEKLEEEAAAAIGATGDSGSPNEVRGLKSKAPPVAINDDDDVPKGGEGKNPDPSPTLLAESLQLASTRSGTSPSSSSSRPALPRPFPLSPPF